jgi:hypothetical protein
VSCLEHAGSKAFYIALVKCHLETLENQNVIGIYFVALPFLSSWVSTFRLSTVSRTRHVMCHESDFNSEMKSITTNFLPRKDRIYCDRNIMEHTVSFITRIISASSVGFLLKERSAESRNSACCLIDCRLCLNLWFVTSILKTLFTLI